MSKKAFTLIEMLVTITIISILAGFVVVKINDSNNLAKDTQRKADINLLANSVVSYSSDHYSGKPITDENGCTIGGGTDRCSTEIEDALKAYLPTLPSEPSSSAYYIYWSNGNDCTVTANLSSSNPDDAYVYSCTPDTASAGDAVNGACGSSANTSATGYASSVSDWPSSNFCNSGTLHTSPAWPVQGGSTTWTCVGEYLGNNVTCTAYRAQDAVCGTREKRYADAATSYGTDTICTIGTGSPASPAFPAKGASTTWTCAGVYTGTSTTCTAQHSLNGVCGTNAQAYASGVTAYSGTFCAAGTASPASPAFPASGASVSWTCLGALSGTNASCTASRAGAPVAGTCGTSAQTCDSIALASAPTANLCATGTASALSGTGPWTWTCAGLYGGATSGTCTAYKANLCNSQHASQQCTCKGGTVVSVGSCSVCKLG
ncbi:MAG: type II secretion system protein, partial [Candidatus Paceibacterota bacterium]